MKISNETKVGVLAISALTLLILGFNFLKGKDLFSKTKKIYAVFPNLGSLEKSNEVRINGLPIGLVADRKEKDKAVSGIVVTINLTRDIDIPDNSVAFIGSSLVGASFITIERGDSKTYLKPGDTLHTRAEEGIVSQVSSQINPTLTKVRSVLDTLSSTLTGVNGLLNSEAKLNLQQILSNLNRASSSLNGLLDNQTGVLSKTLNNANAMVDSLKQNTGNINAIVSNTKIASEKLAALQLKPTVDSLNAMIAQLKSAVQKISSKDGTLGALINDKTLYNKLNDAILSAEILMDDLRAHPKRYVNISVFGKKDKTGPITSPLPKDTIPSGYK